MAGMCSLAVPSRERLEFEGDVISALFQPSESASRRWRSRQYKGGGGSGRRAVFLGDDWFDPLEAGPACEASFVHGPWSL
jgi:hypothetical protein